MSKKRRSYLNSKKRKETLAIIAVYVVRVFLYEEHGLQELENLGARRKGDMSNDFNFVFKAYLF